MDGLLRIAAGVLVGVVFAAGAGIADDDILQDDGFAALNAVSESDLDTLRAGDGNFGLNVLVQTVTLTGDQNGAAGDVNVSDNAFSGISGIATMLFNTGNNVAMGSEMIVNVYITSGP